MRTFVAGFRDAIPDAHKWLDDCIATTGRVTIRYTLSGTHEGELLGVPATGREVSITGVAIYRVSDGTLAEAWYVADFLRALKQLGVVD